MYSVLFKPYVPLRTAKQVKMPLKVKIGRRVSAANTNLFK